MSVIIFKESESTIEMVSNKPPPSQSEVIKPRDFVLPFPES
jgi:hypothetical protein